MAIHNFFTKKRKIEDYEALPEKGKYNLINNHTIFLKYVLSL